jgi:ABC-type multidrug transport system fused ATPase/permease subunit
VKLAGDLRALLAAIPRRRRLQLLMLLGLMFASALAEVVSLGAVIPFLAVLSDPAGALERPQVRWLVAHGGLEAGADLRLQFSILFGSAAIAAGALRLLLVYATARINYGIGHEIGAEVYRRALYLPYHVQVTRNSSEVIAGLAKVDVVVQALFQALMSCSSIISATLIVAVLVAIDPFVATCAMVLFGGIYAAISIFISKRLNRNSRVIGRAVTGRVQSAQEGLGGIRDVLLDHAQPVFSRRFNEIDWELRRAQASINILAPSPRFAIEALGMVLIALLAYYLSGTGGVAAAIPTLGALALGAQRLMPMLQQVYQGWVYVTGHRQEVADVRYLLSMPAELPGSQEGPPLPFAADIRFNAVSFRYRDGDAEVVERLDLSIPKGARIGFVGATGSGKSTVMDLLMGLLTPTAGEIRIDGTALSGSARLAWQRNIAHVPQSIFLADASFAENIGFGVAPGQINEARVRAAANQARIAEFIESSPASYGTTVGERGVRLSGGQRQRIGIARALYRQAKVLVLDEATSALDSETESAIMEAIYGLGRDLTIVIIAHRISTLQHCDVVHRLDRGRLVYSGTYDEIVAAHGAIAEGEDSRGKAPPPA